MPRDRHLVANRWAEASGVSTSHVDRHSEGSVGRYCVRFLGGRLELAFPGRDIDTPTRPAMVGPLVVLALHPRRPVGLDALKAYLHDDPFSVTTAQIQTPISRLRLAGLPIPPRQYMLDIAPADVDVVDFDHRAKAFIERGVQSERTPDTDLDALIAEGHRLHELWQEDPSVAVGDQARLHPLFERFRRRNRRFGEVLVRLLVRTGDRDRAQDVLADYIDRYGPDEVLRDLELHVRGMPRHGDRDATPAHGLPLLVGPVPQGSAVAELWDRVAASSHLRFAQVAVSAQNLDRIYAVDHLEVDHEIRIRGVPVAAAGGAGANTAVGLARMGRDVAVAGIVADDRDGVFLRESLVQEGVDIGNLLVVPPSPDARTGYCLAFGDPQGKRQELVDPGVNDRYAAALRDDRLRYDHLLDTIRSARIVNLSSFIGEGERHLQEELLLELPPETVVAFDPGTFYCRLHLDRLTPFILRCDVLYLLEMRLRQLVENSSANPGWDNGYSFRATLDALFRWRSLRVRRPLMVVVKRDRQRGGAGEPAEPYELITIAVGGSSVEDMVSAGAARFPAAAEITGEGQAIAAGVHLGLLGRAPLDECADLAFVFANAANSQLGARTGLPRRSDVAAAWETWLPGQVLPAWVPNL
jgi:sugar/nucleoside kinase (ribokinase family)